MFLLNIEVFNIMTPDFPYTSENETRCIKLYFCMFYFHLFNVLLKKVKNVDIFHEIDKKGYMSGCLSKPLTFFFAWKHIFIFLMICSMDISNVIYLLKKKFIDTIFFYSTLRSIFFGFHQSQLQAILPKKGSHFEKKK